MSHATVLIAISPDELKLHSSIEAAVEWNMFPFNETGECFKDGSRWDWYQIGGRYSGRLCGSNAARRDELPEDRILEYQTERAKKLWAEWQAEPEQDDILRSMIYGLKPTDTEESVIAAYRKKRISAYAFLRKRCWHEGERLGWFGGTAKTECEIKAESNWQELKGKCLHRDVESGASIVSWNDPQWDEKFWLRFVDKLPPDTTLVMVDYHV